MGRRVYDILGDMQVDQSAILEAADGKIEFVRRNQIRADHALGRHGQHDPPGRHAVVAKARRILRWNPRIGDTAECQAAKAWVYGCVEVHEVVEVVQRRRLHEQIRGRRMTAVEPVRERVEEIRIDVLESRCGRGLVPNLDVDGFTASAARTTAGNG